MNDDLDIKMAIEAILFAKGDGVSLKSLSMAIGLDNENTKKAVDELKNWYDENKRGIGIVYADETIRLCSRQEYNDYIARLVTKEKDYKLSAVALETLAIIAYKQPVTKVDIERIRGVKSDYAVNQLVEYGIVEERGRSTSPGRPILFGTTNEFLLSFGLRSLGELPMPNQSLLEEFSNEAKKELNYMDTDELSIEIEDIFEDMD